ncbi:MAG: hypothetical protein K6U87_03180 [Firmicutes bacterium]|nr:hypothetical protein [Bacillota bacterium]
MTSLDRIEALVAEYLAALDAALTDVPAARRRQILEDVRQHLEAARASLPPDDEAGIRAVLDRLGDPAAIAAEAGVGFSRRPRWVDAAVPWLLLLGGFVGGGGWLVGAALLWTSRVWRLRDKIWGTLVWPGGLFGVGVAFGTVVGGVQTCSGSTVAGHPLVMHCTSRPGWSEPVGIAVLVGIFCAQLVTVGHLERVRRGAAR